MLEQVVRLTVNFSVSQENLDAFRAVAAEMTEGTNAEPGTLGYEWFVSADGKRFRLVETYADIAAIEAHFMGSVVQQLVPRLTALCTVDGFEFYGDPGPKVTAMAGAFSASFYKYWMGIGR